MTNLDKLKEAPTSRRFAWLTAIAALALPAAAAATPVQIVTPVGAVPTVADLKALPGRPLIIWLQGYWAAGDGGGGWVTWFDGDSTTANDGTVFQCTGGPSGRYKRNVCKGDHIASDWFGVIGDGAVRDITARFQALTDFCWTSSVDTCFEIKLTEGRVKTTAPINTASRNICMSGNYNSSVIQFSDSAGDCFNFTGGSSLFLQLSGFSIVGDNTGTHSALNFDNAAILTDSQFSNLYLESGGDTFVASVYGMFSVKLDRVDFFSHSGHGIRAQCNNSVAFISCYAMNCGPLKAGFRLGGSINMLSCNGLNGGDFWGAFGNDTTNPTFGGDFAFNNFPTIILTGCNIEDWAQSASHASVSAIYVVNGYLYFSLRGCFLTRSSSLDSTSYHSVIRTLGGGHPNPAILAMSTWNRGAATLTSGVALYADGNNVFVDEGGVIAGFGDTTSIVNGTNTIPIVQRTSGWNDEFLNSGDIVSGLVPDRINTKFLDFQEVDPASGTTSIDVSLGSTIVTANTGATTILNAHFSGAAGTPSQGLNGRMLFIQCGDTHTTLKHLDASNGNFKLLGGADLLLTQNQQYMFLYYPKTDGTHYGWKQIA